MGSLRESQAILKLGAEETSQIHSLADRLGANLFRLIRAVQDELS